jgi:5,10-methylenetetrahydromethanopterin reductase
MDPSSELKFSLELHPIMSVRDCLDFVRTAEDLGVDRVWFGDSHLIWREAYTLMAAAAVQTSRIGLGLAVTNATTRHPTLVAGAMSTLQEISGGRITCGIGLGDSALETIGLKPVKRAELEQSIGLMRQMWDRADDVVTVEGGPELKFSWGSPERVPVHYGASGPRMLEDGGRVGDGVITYVGLAPERIAVAMSHIEKGAAQAGRTSADLDITLWVPCAVDDDAQRATASVKAHVSRALLHALPGERTDLERDTIERLKAVYEYSDHMSPGSDHSSLVPDELVPAYAIAGNPKQCREQLENLLAGTGITNFGLIPMGEDRIGIAQRFIHDVVEPTITTN